MERFPKKPGVKTKPSPEVRRAQPVGSTDDPSGHTVHVIEPDEDTLVFLRDFLSIPGYQVSGSIDPVRALEHVSRTRPEVVICDLVMKEMDGEEFVSRTREASPKTRVILTTDRFNATGSEAFQTLGGADLVLRSRSAIGLLGAVEHVLKIGR
jgi:DNA-binding response OmpR family regulator